MEISNPIASQYVMNQGLASQLTAQSTQLQIKSDRFTVGNPPENNKVPAPTDEEQRLRSEEDKKKQQNTLADSSTNNTSENTQELLLASEQSILPNINITNQQNTNSIPVALSQQNNQFSAPIQSYLETSAMTSPSSGISSRVDFFV